MKGFPYTLLVILNQPPLLPTNASRAAIRDGMRPPFYEDEVMHSRRVETNQYLECFNKENVMIVDIASHFQVNNREVLFMDSQGRQLYHDAGHLSGYGADLVRSDLVNAILQAPKSDDPKFYDPKSLMANIGGGAEI